MFIFIERTRREKEWEGERARTEKEWDDNVEGIRKFIQQRGGDKSDVLLEELKANYLKLRKTKRLNDHHASKVAC